MYSKLIPVLPLCLFACSADTASSAFAEQTKAAAPQENRAVIRPVLDNSYHVAACYPHDREAFTQGLFYYDGALYESTGQVGESTIRKVDLKTGQVEMSATVPKPYFGEGSVQWDDEIISLSWRAGVGFRWSLDDFAEKSRFNYTGQGWGLTRNESELIMSDGTASLRFLEPDSFSEKRRVNVTAAGLSIDNLNELEWVDGEILANVWMSSQIVVIDPENGTITRVIDLTALTKAIASRDSDAVLNGIAWDSDNDRLFVTGKRWPWLFELRKGVPREGSGCQALPTARL